MSRQLDGRVAELGAIDILVNNAATVEPAGPTATAPADVVDIVLDAVRDVATATQPAGRTRRVATASALS